MKYLIIRIVSLALAIAIVAASWPGSSTLTRKSDSEYVLSYTLDLFNLTKTNDVTNILAAGVGTSTDMMEIVAGTPTRWNGVGPTVGVSHMFSFAPVLVAVFGITAGIPGGADGTDKDHIVLGTNVGFTSEASGKKFSVNFPGKGADTPYYPGENRMRHSKFVSAVKAFPLDDATGVSVDALGAFVIAELVPIAGFVPNGSFSIIRFTPGGTTGACCDDGSCTRKTESNCISSGGSYQGAGTACPPEGKKSKGPKICGKKGGKDSGKRTLAF